MSLKSLQEHQTQSSHTHIYNHTPVNVNTPIDLDNKHNDHSKPTRGPIIKVPHVDDLTWTSTKPHKHEPCVEDGGKQHPKDLKRRADKQQKPQPKDKTRTQPNRKGKSKVDGLKGKGLGGKCGHKTRGGKRNKLVGQSINDFIAKEKGHLDAKVENMGDLLNEYFSQHNSAKNNTGKGNKQHNKNGGGGGGGGGPPSNSSNSTATTIISPETQARLDKEAADKKIAEEQKLVQEHLDNLNAKARLMWTSRDVANTDERKVVLTSVLQLARGGKMHERIDNIAKICGDIVNKSMYDVVEERETRLMYSTMYRSQASLLTMYKNFMANGLRTDNLRNNETANPYEPIICLPNKRTIKHHAMKCVVPIVEEVVKKNGTRIAKHYIQRLVNGCIGNSNFRINSYIQPFMPWAPPLINAASHLVSSYLFAKLETTVRGCDNETSTYLTFVHCALGLVGAMYGTVPAICLHILHNYLQQTQANISNNTKPSVKMAKNIIVVDKCCEDEKLCDVQNEFKLIMADTHCKPKFGFRLAWTLKECQPFVYRLCSHNIQFALHERIGKLTPCLKGTMNDVLMMEKVMRTRWNEAAYKFLYTYRSLHVKTPMPMPQFLKRYPEARRMQFVTAIKNEHEMDRTANCFLKREIGFEKFELNKPPRVISGAKEIVTVTAGPSVVVSTKQVKDRWMPRFCTTDFENGRHIIYTSGMNTAQVGDSWLKAIKTIEGTLNPGDRLIYIEDDQNRFDLHLTGAAFSAIGKIEKRTLTRKSYNTLKRNRNTKGCFPDGTRYKVPFTMASGSSDTAYADTLANALMKCDIYHVGTPWYALICGDDSCTVMSYEYYMSIVKLRSLDEQYAEFGMEVTIKTTFEMEDVEFCSSRFLYTPDTAMLIPKPGRMLSKILCDITPRSEKQHVMWLRSVVTTLKAYGACDPVYNAIACALNPGDGPKLNMDFDYQYKHAPIYPLVDRLYIYQYYARFYDISVEDYETLLIRLSQQKYGEICDDPLINRLHIDTL